MFLNLPDEQLRAICRTHIEALEKWMRLMLHLALTEKYGNDYLHVKNADGNYKFKTKLVENADKMKAAEPGRFPTLLDTLFLDDLIYMVCHNDIYSTLSGALRDFYPEGMQETRTFLNRIVPVRNKLSHTNPFSERDAQRAVCYSNDFIDAAKEYFKQKKMTDSFNVPTIIRISDSFGNEMLPPNAKSFVYELKDPETSQPLTLHHGDKFSVTLEIDPSFNPNDYDLRWDKTEGLEIYDNGKKVTISIGNNLIGEKKLIGCYVISHNDWHRSTGYDQFLVLKFTALPMPTV